MRTQVGIVGAGPAGLMLAHLLHLEGIESVVLEDRTREYVEHRIRAGVLEQRTADLLSEAGVGERMQREGLVHHGIGLQFDGERHRIPLTELSGGLSIVIYGQTEVVKDLIQARLDAEQPLLFEAEGVSVHDFDSERPAHPLPSPGPWARARVRCDRGLRRLPGRLPREHSGESAQLVLAGVPLRLARDSRRGATVARRGRLRASRARLRPPEPTLPELSRLYIQCHPDEDLAEWPDERIWEELQLRLGLEGWTLAEGPVLEKGVTGMRSFVVEPMQFGRLFLAGDAAHIVPPTGAKGLNLAIADVHILAEALTHWYRSGDRSLLDGYSDTCLRRVWRAEHFSWWMTHMLHLLPGGDPFDVKLQLSQLSTSRARRRPA